MPIQLKRLLLLAAVLLAFTLPGYCAWPGATGNFATIQLACQDIATSYAGTYAISVDVTGITYGPEPFSGGLITGICELVFHFTSGASNDLAYIYPTCS